MTTALQFIKWLLRKLVSKTITSDGFIAKFAVFCKESLRKHTAPFTLLYLVFSMIVPVLLGLILNVTLDVKPEKLHSYLLYAWSVLGITYLILVLATLFDVFKDEQEEIMDRLSK